MRTYVRSDLHAINKSRGAEPVDADDCHNLGLTIGVQSIVTSASGQESASGITEIAVLRGIAVAWMTGVVLFI